jgi:hypothetical protein
VIVKKKVSVLYERTGRPGFAAVHFVRLVSREESLRSLRSNHTKYEPFSNRSGLVLLTNSPLLKNRKYR